MLMICTTGTSIARDIAWKGDGAAYREAIRARVAGLAGKPGFAAHLCAEINSLDRYGIDRVDRVALMHSETEDGRICAEEVAGAIEAHMSLPAKTIAIAGLQVDDVARFRRVGIQNLFGTIADLHREAGSAVLNITGGFKSVVPYITLYGLLYRLPVVYVFERSPTLIELPPAAVSFDHARIARAGAALTRLRQEGTLTRDAFFALIPGLDFNERDAYDTLLEEEEGLVTASAFAHLLLPVLEEAAEEVWVCEPARAALERSAGQVRENFEHMLDNMGNLLWRAIKVHAFNNTELVLFRKGMRTSERLGAFFRNGRVYVAELWQHDDYIREAPARRITAYNLANCTRWEPKGDTGPGAWNERDDDAGGDASAVEPRLVSGERKRLRDLEQLYSKASEKAERLAVQVGNLEAKLRQRNDELAAEQQERGRIAAELDLARGALPAPAATRGS